MVQTLGPFQVQHYTDHTAPKNDKGERIGVIVIDCTKGEPRLIKGSESRQVSDVIKEAWN